MKKRPIQKLAEILGEFKYQMYVAGIPEMSHMVITRVIKTLEQEIPKFNTRQFRKEITITAMGRLPIPHTRRRHSK